MLDAKGANNGCKTAVSRNLTRLMEERNVSRRTLSKDLNIKYTTLCDWINGNSFPRASALSALAGYFGISESEFFIEIAENNNSFSRLNKYMSELTLNPSTIEFMTDDQIRELLNRGFSFKHRTLEEYIALSERPLKASTEIDHGKPIGDEIW